MSLIPEPSLKGFPVNHRDHWQELQRRVEGIWCRWEDEYLTSFQPRKKWRTVHPKLKVDQLVLVKNGNAPPTQWEIARRTDFDIDRTLRLFWEDQELQNAKPWTKDEKTVIEHFDSTVTRSEEGRFIVRLPLVVHE